MGQGKETCRYLGVGSRLECFKTSCSFKKDIDKRVKNNEMVAKGDNCMGLLGLIIQNQEKLKGNKASYIRCYCQMNANFKKIEIEDEDKKIETEDEDKILKITMCWNNKKKLEFAFSINELDIIVYEEVNEQVNEQSINFFQNLGLGNNFIQRFAIFL